VRRGRPRDPRVDQAVLSAAVSLLGEVGYSALTVDDVATRAGVSKASVYLRWPGKVALVADALGHGAALLPDPPDTGTLRDDVHGFLSAVVTSHEDGFARAASAVSGEIMTNPELRDAFRHSLISNVSDRVSTIVERAVQRGELSSGTDVELLSLLPMAVLQHVRLAQDPRPNPHAVVDRIVEQFFSPPAPHSKRGGPTVARKAPSHGA